MGEALHLELNRPRTLGDLLGATFTLYGRYFVPFAGIALAVVAPVDTLLYGVMLGQLWSGYDEASPGLSALAGLGSQAITVPLVTAMHVHAVMDVGAGRRPSAIRSLRRGLAIFLPLLLAMAMLAAGLFLAFIALIIPGIYFFVRWYFVPQAVVADGRRGADAFERSSDLVQGAWWRIAGIVLALNVIVSIASYAVFIPLELAANAADSGQVQLLGAVLAETISISFIALTGTLLYFDARARKWIPPHPPPDHRPPPQRPEAPGP